MYCFCASQCQHWLKLIDSAPAVGYKIYIQKKGRSASEETQAMAEDRWQKQHQAHWLINDGFWSRSIYFRNPPEAQGACVIHHPPTHKKQSKKQKTNFTKENSSKISEKKNTTLYVWVEALVEFSGTIGGFLMCVASFHIQGRQMTGQFDKSLLNHSWYKADIQSRRIYKKTYPTFSRQ